MLNSGMDEVENRVHSGRHLMPWKIIKKKYAERYFVFERFFYKSNCKRFHLSANVVNIGFVFMSYNEIDNEKNYEKGISWARRCFAGARIKIPIAFRIREQNFD